MRDLITHTIDSTAFMAEVAAKFPEHVIYDESTPPIAVGVSITKTPTVRSLMGTLAVVRVSASQLADIKTLTTITILAEVPMNGDLLKAMSKANRAVYDAVHDQSTQTITLPDGSTYTYTPPALIGAFAQRHDFKK